MAQSSGSSGGISVDRFSVVLVAVAATLWASDAYFRNQLITHLTPTQIVVAEDGLITLFLLPVLIRSAHELRHLGWKGWLAVVIIAAGAQSLATILFTASFQQAATYKVFAETFVLQQTQPLIAIVLAWIILGERRRAWFWPALLVAMVGVYLVVFAQDPTAPVRRRRLLPLPVQRLRPQPAGDCPRSGAARPSPLLPSARQDARFAGHHR